jgi:hypothetical protein
MAGGFGQLHLHVRRGQRPLANLDFAQLSASRTRLRLVEQFRLPKREVGRQVSRDCLSHSPRGRFDASKGGVFSGHLRIVQIDSKFSGEAFDQFLIFGSPFTSEHKSILKLTTAEVPPSRRASIPKLAAITY